MRRQGSGSNLERRDVARRDDGEGIRHQERALPRRRDDALQKLPRRLPPDRVAVMSVRGVLQLSFLPRGEAGRDRRPPVTSGLLLLCVVLRRRRRAAAGLTLHGDLRRCCRLGGRLLCPHVLYHGIG